MTQLELWNDKPQPWRLRMEQDAFEIAFPDEERTEDDSVEIQVDYVNEREPHACSLCGFDSGSPSQFNINVIWRGRPTRIHERLLDRRFGEPLFVRRRSYSKKDAEKFWVQLMERGSV